MTTILAGVVGCAIWLAGGWLFLRVTEAADRFNPLNDMTDDEWQQWIDDTADYGTASDFACWESEIAS